MKLATATEMREIDRRAIEEYGLAGEALMENAGCAAASAARRLWRAAGGAGKVVVLCGPGNNGGDGLVLARRLHSQGLPVRVLLLAPGEKLRGDAALNYHRACRAGVSLVETPSPATLRRAVREAGLVVDALLGTGLSGPVRGEIGEAIAVVNEATTPHRRDACATEKGPLVLAVDIPSGINSETGAVLGAAVCADLTVTFGLAKVGMYCYPGRVYCGEIQVADISHPRALLERRELATELITPARAAAGLPRRWPEMHKGDAGRVLIIAGSLGMTGAAALAANAAVRAGAGLVYLAIPAPLNAILEEKCTEPITLPQPATPAGSLALAAAEGLLERAGECEAVVLGPGLGRDPETAELARRLVAGLRGSLVVDADALNALAGQAELLARRPGPTVITPHPGELARLRGEPVETLQSDRVAMARQTTAELGCVTIFKGAGTICADPSGLALLNATGNHGLASGGTGDVLAGMLGAFLAGGRVPLEAAAAAVYYHGRAADLYAQTHAARSLAAGDLLEYLPLALGEAGTA